MTKENNIKASKSHYLGEYDDLGRFISYFYQIDIVKNLEPDNILEIGVGNKTVSNYSMFFAPPLYP